MNDLGKLTAHLLATVADLIVAPIAKAGADHIEIRAKLAEYHAGETGALALPAMIAVAGEFHEAAVGAVRNRYAGWLDHPRLAHEPLIKEGKAADVGLHEALVRLKEGWSGANLLLLWAAIVRVAAITEVMGDACVYSEPKRSRAPKGGGARRGPKSRARDIRLTEVPRDLHALIVGIAYGEEADRSAAIAGLEALRGTDFDVDAVVTKLAMLVRDEANGTINRLAAEIRKVAFASGAGAADLVEPGASSRVAPTGAADAPPAVDEVPIEQAVTATDRSSASSVGDEAHRAAEATLLAFCRRQHWAMTDEGGKLVLHANKPKIVDAFALVGEDADVQARLRDIIRSHKAADGLPERKTS